MLTEYILCVVCAINSFNAMCFPNYLEITRPFSILIIFFLVHSAHLEKTTQTGGYALAVVSFSVH